MNLIGDKNTLLDLDKVDYIDRDAYTDGDMPKSCEVIQFSSGETVKLRGISEFRHFENFDEWLKYCGT